jgi:hypothetical protein
MQSHGPLIRQAGADNDHEGTTLLINCRIDAHQHGGVE